MIGSPDLLAFTGAEGFGEGEEDRGGPGLPEELSVPLLPPSQPWTTSARFHRDFILVAEFSEQVGPRPVLTIPDDPRVVGSFDLNHFSVRIMSVDYQASGPGHAHHASAGPRLNFSEDSEVILGDSAEDAFAYVRHLTLYDLEARGMVRPFCVAYVCSDQAKLTENFSEMSARFSRAADSLKTGNRQAFSAELQRKLQELEYARLTLLREAGTPAANGVAGVGGNSGELEAVERSILNHRDLLRQVTSYPNRKLKQPDFLPYDPADSLADPAALLPPEPCPPASSASSTSSACRSEHQLKSLQELCNSYFLSLMKEQLADAERRLRGDRSVLRTARVSRSLSRRLALTNFLFERWSAEDEEEEEEDERAESGEAGTGNGVREIRSEPASLESFCSCVEEIPIKLEAVEAGTLTPDPGVVTETAGSVSSSDSIEVLGTEKSYRAQRGDAAGSDSGETWPPPPPADASARRAVADAGVRRARAYAVRANSEDSIEVLSTTESIFPEDLSAITEEEAEHQPPSNGFRGEAETATGRESDEGREAASGSERDNADEDESCGRDPIREEPVAERPKEDEVAAPLKAAAAKSKPKWSAKVHKLVPDLQVKFAPPDADPRPPPRPPLRLLSVDEASDCASLDPPSPTQNVAAGAGRSDRRKRRRKAGLRALRFLRQNSFSQHAVFCLLSGRPLVIVGGDEASVGKLVDALSLFLPAPGPDGNAVMPRLSTPLQLTDLLTWRLIGIHRSSSSSSSGVVRSLTRYSRYLALLDLDQRTLRSPPYSGSLVGGLADPNASIGRGATYLLHLESCLTALANRALLHTFKPGSGGGAGAAGGICGGEGDLRVVDFLSDLIKQRHAGRGPPVLRFSYSSVQLHRNTNAP